MSVLVVGSVAYDSVRTPAGNRTDALGGSATYFSVSGSYFTPVSLVAAVGEDFCREDIELFNAHSVDISGLERKKGKTFRWAGRYGTEDINTRDTLDTQLNVFADFSPQLNLEHRKHLYLFLANIHPKLQQSVLDQMITRPELVALDSMNFWIDGHRDALTDIVGSADVLFMDEGVARSFSGEVNLVRAARSILSLGPKVVVVKRGEHGVLLFQDESVFFAPAMPLDQVVDPTGAGDSFAGGFLGYLAGTGDLSSNGFRRAAILGCVMGSFAVESFGLDRLSSLTRADVVARFQSLTSLTQFTPLAEDETLPWQSGH